ncbi:MAG: bifunctional heptose 7-phosphate kinase/heptose 1-phosphate adenyltransferase [Pseudomonadota bacterium]
MKIKDMCKLLVSGKQPLITVFGDYCLDKYMYIDADRDEMSVETGLTAFQVVRRKSYAGAAGTIVNNLRALGAQVYCVGILGDDGDGFELERCLKKTGAETRYMVLTDERSTCTYEKPIRCERGNETEINRLDIRNFTRTPMPLQERLLENLEGAIAASDAVIICDQFAEEDLAAVTAHIRKELGRIAEMHKGVIFYADSRRFADRFRNCIIKCNEKELAGIFGISHEAVDTETALNYAGQLYERNRKPVYVTLGERGSIVYDGYPHRLPAFRVDGPIDVVGAGDAFNAAAVFALAKGAGYGEAALVGNAASSIVLRQLRTTGVAKLAEVTALLEAYAGGRESI